MVLSKLFKKKNKKSSSTSSGEPEMVYSMEPRHGHGQDVLDENGIRQVAGCLPIDPINKRFLLISSSSNAGAWVIPKGGWEKDETQKQAAMRETWEEAGVKGVITRHIGVFAEKSKTGIKAHHWIYEMEIKEVTKKFPEQKKRQRRWFSYDEAMLAVKAHYIHDALSMSSLSPLVHPVAETVEKKKKKNKKKEKKSDEEGDSAANTDEDGEKKKKKKKKEKKSDDEEENTDDDGEKKKKKKKDKKNKEVSDAVDETISFNGEGDENKEKKEKKKDKKKKKKEDDEGIDIREVELDENGSPIVTEEKKKKKKNKDKKKDEDNESKIELEDYAVPPKDEISQIPPMYTNISSAEKTDISIPIDTKPIINNDLNYSHHQTIQ